VPDKLVNIVVRWRPPECVRAWWKTPASHWKSRTRLASRRSFHL